MRRLARSGLRHAHGQAVLAAGGPGRAAGSRRAADRAGTGGGGSGQARHVGTAALADYAEVSEPALDKLAELAALDIEVPLGDLGTYPATVLPCAYSFDHYTHIRADLFRPRGPLTGAPPPSDELRLGPALDWVEAALPQQNPAAADAGAVEMQVTGTGARSSGSGTGQAMATISSDGPDLIRWVTQRGNWEDLGVEAAGDEAALAAARKLKVF